jgi:hypothetical protein
MPCWMGLRQHITENSPSLRGTKVPNSGCCAQRNIPHEPTYKRVRLRMFRRSTHVAFRARSFCDHWRGDLARRQTGQPKLEK